MIILGQSLEENENAAYANAFFVGMSKQEYYLQVRHKIGDIVRVKVNEATSATLIGEIVENKE